MLSTPARTAVKAQPLHCHKKDEECCCLWQDRDPQPAVLAAGGRVSSGAADRSRQVPRGEQGPRCRIATCGKQVIVHVIILHPHEPRCTALGQARGGCWAPSSRQKWQEDERCWTHCLLIINRAHGNRLHIIIPCRPPSWHFPSG